MADTTTERAFSESEMTAILADRVASETAGLTASVDQLTAQVTELGGKLDVETSAREAAEQKAAVAEKALEDYKSDIAAREEAAKRKDERVAKIREAASHLPEEFYADEARIARITAYDDDGFESYLGDLRETAKGIQASTSPEPPRESAMHGEKVTAPEGKTGGAAKAFLLRAYNPKPKED